MGHQVICRWLLHLPWESRPEHNIPWFFLGERLRQLVKLGLADDLLGVDTSIPTSYKVRSTLREIERKETSQKHLWLMLAIAGSDVAIFMNEPSFLIVSAEYERGFARELY
jgi:hypothetical protein